MARVFAYYGRNVDKSAGGCGFAAEKGVSGIVIINLFITVAKCTELVTDACGQLFA